MADVAALARNSKPVLTHYDTLGVSSKATHDELTRAFARKMSVVPPLSVAAFARLSVAYETLRDPQKRRAYDASLNPAPKPNYDVQWSPAPVAAIALVDRLTRPVEDRRPVNVPIEARPANERIAKSSQAPIPVVEERSSPELSAASEARSESRPIIDGTAAPIRHALIMNDDRLDWRLTRRDDQSAIEWKRVAAAVGWPILGIAMIGGTIGWAVGTVDQQQQQQANALQIPLPPLEPSLERTDLSALAQPSVEKRPIESATRAVVAPVSQARIPAKTEVESKDTAVLGDSNPQEADAAASVQAVEQPLREGTSATMPLSDKLIARTIGRIGYSCGEVASTIAMEGGTSGVFKVTCTSGDTYRASPVRGRYRFRRIAGG